MHYIYSLVTLLLQAFFINIATSTILKNPGVKKIVELYKGNDDFSKYWPLFDQFVPCTIHFARTPSEWLNMHSSFLERCRYLGYCTVLQTSYFEPVDRYSSLLLKAWNRTDFEHLSSTFWNIFLPHRFHQVCTVQLNFGYQNPYNSLNKADPWLFSAVSPYKSYIILPVDFQINSNSSVLRIYGPTLGTSKLICLNKNSPAIYMACLTCITERSRKGKTEQFGWMLLKPLIKLIFFPITVSNLDIVWHYYHSNKNNLNTKSVTVKSVQIYIGTKIASGVIKAYPIWQGTFNATNK